MENPDLKEAGMTEALPIACSLGAEDLKRRLAGLAAIGEQGLIGRESDGGTHLLRFRPDSATRSRLEEIVATEAQCCPFLDLALEERGEELILSIAAPEGGQVVADELASAFVESRLDIVSRAQGAPLPQP
ncbi:MAG TPA: hypothetical protein VMS11_14865 [Solirubrobacterales bacterium]|nr:hypothetical protein [Solirubrobacterales bacterium]